MILVLYDTETTGLNPDGTVPNTKRIDDFISLASITIRENEIIHVFDQRANPGIPISEEALTTHGITDEDIKDCLPSRDIAHRWVAEIEALLESPKEKIVLGGHNTQFDRRFISKHVVLDDSVHTLDSYQLALRVFPHMANHKLITLYDMIGVTNAAVTMAHDALSDVYMCWEIVKHCMAKVNIHDYLELAQWLEKPLLLQTMPIGKHKGKPIHLLPTNYLVGMMTLLDPEPKNADILYTFQHHLNERREKTKAPHSTANHLGNLA